jgi:mevalonate pyrophosphate decarboxylase
MIRTLKIRKGPSSSATKFSVGIKKKGNDGNMWKIVKNKNGTKRWLNISNVKSRKQTNKQSEKNKQIGINRIQYLQNVDNADNIRNANKNLYEFWADLADTKHSVFIYNDKSYKIIRKDIREEQEKAEINNNVIAILDSGPSFDAYRELYRKAKNKSVEEVIKNYKKYFNEGSSGKRIFC